jgi:hypothetical protein
MAHFHAALTVPAPPDQVFDRLRRFDRAEEWDPGVRTGELLTPEPVGRGARFRLVTRFFGREVPLEYELVEHTPGQRLVFHAETGAVVSHDVITFVAAPGGTRLVYDARLDLKGVARLFAPVLALGFHRFADRGAAGLRRWLDAVPAG